MSDDDNSLSGDFSAWILLGLVGQNWLGWNYTATRPCSTLRRISDSFHPDSRSAFPRSSPPFFLLI